MTTEGQGLPADYAVAGIVHPRSAPTNGYVC